MNIREEIVGKRRKDLEKEGFTMGSPVPDERRAPLVPFNRDPFLICEIKRSSPSRGDIAAGRDPVAQATAYVENGVKTVSILTEQNYFSGSLDDLMRVKNKFPDLAVLRKDFLLEKEDILVSYRAGADAVLLIASILSAEKLKMLYKAARQLGLRVLLEVHDDEDIGKARSFEPRFTGINSRDLSTFTVDPALPLMIKRGITWETSLVFESGIHCGEDALFALSAGFNGILVGEAVMRNPGLIPEIREAYARDGGDFWPRLFSRKLKERPLVKICGITNKEDACRAAELGADMLGFIFAESPRRAEPALARELADLDILKVGVVVAGAKARLDDRISGLLEDGLLSAIQFHGDEQPAACFKTAFPYYKVLQLKGADDIHAIAGYRCPRVLVDAPADNLRGGTGKILGSELIEKAKQEKPLWLAGGLGPHNITDIIRRFEPELVDAASRLEAAPGKKDPDLLTTYFKEIERAQIL